MNEEESDRVSKLILLSRLPCPRRKTRQRTRLTRCSPETSRVDTDIRALLVTIGGSSSLASGVYDSSGGGNFLGDLLFVVDELFFFVDGSHCDVRGLGKFCRMGRYLVERRGKRETMKNRKRRHFGRREN